MLFKRICAVRLGAKNGQDFLITAMTPEQRLLPRSTDVSLRYSSVVPDNPIKAGRWTTVPQAQ